MASRLGTAPLPAPISILLVDDEPHNIVALEAALATVDCTLVTAQSGHEAVDYLFKPFDADILRAKVAIFVELFRKTAALEQRTRELHQLTNTAITLRGEAEAALAVMRRGYLLLRVLTIDLAALVHTVALRYAETGGELHHLTADVSVVPVMVAGDAGRLEQVLDNLLNNAVKYSPGGGEIGVSLHRADDGGVVLVVSDHGIGLSPGAQDRIFEPFGRAANARQRELPGMGLGLHICRRIAEAHGGRISAQSDGEGRGMTVSLWLPAA